ncbi:hypothetical protein HZA33_04025 [Candidatus Pacearchaeota archaeon]|nr:hypothetical protein [Candidatus Pacearchaeota archaeon]
MGIFKKKTYSGYTIDLGLFKKKKSVNDNVTAETTSASDSGAGVGFLGDLAGAAEPSTNVDSSSSTNSYSSYSSSSSSDIQDRVSLLSDKIYRLIERIELLERKIERLERGNF